MNRSVASGHSIAVRSAPAWFYRCDSRKRPGALLRCAAMTAFAVVFGLTNPLGQAEEIRDVIGRRNAGLDQERAFYAIAFAIVDEAERSCHATCR